MLAVLLVLGGCSGSDDSPPPGDPSPVRCGDGHVDLGEQCDGLDDAGRSCSTYGRGVEGTLRCTSECTFDFSDCRNATCGNDRIDTLNSPIFGSCEVCDGAALGGATCEGFGGTGTLRCGAGCGLERTGCDGVCFNGRLDPGEPCDFDPQTFTPLIANGATCESLGLGHGSLYCTWGGGSVATPYGTAQVLGCTLGVFGCESATIDPVCGDGFKSGSEDCDGSDLGSLTCDALGLTGTLRCNSSCRFDFSECGFAPTPAVCGDGILQAGEECDGSRYAPIPDGPSSSQLQACVGASVFSTGTPLCHDCRLDLSRCAVPAPPRCGDDVAQQYEACDGDDLRGMTCADLGGTGNLRCSGCSLDRTECRDVGGNGRREGDEPCDFGPFGTSDVGGATCGSLGYGKGDLSCGAMPRSYPSFGPGQRFDPVLLMRVVTWSCTTPGTCGDGRATDWEECDGDDFAGVSCETFGATGTLHCNASCGIDLSECRTTARCGDGRIDFGEECEPGIAWASCAADGGVGEYLCDPEFCFVDPTACTFACPGQLADE